MQYRAGPYTERLDQYDAVASVGSKGDSYANAVAEAFNSLFKAECVRNRVMRPRGGWRGVGDVGLAVAEHIDWFNLHRLHGEIDHAPPVEYEAAY
ncbi:transposase InsO family protein [Rhodococcus sp. 27YEA6]